MAKIGIIGGSGIYEIFSTEKAEIKDTPYGKPSATVALGRIEGQEFAFLPRFGKRHTFPPHKIPYKANLWALKELGIERIISHTNVGSINKKFGLGDIVLADQFINQTFRRDNTFFHQPPVTHVSLARPFCPHLRASISQISEETGLKFHPSGTIVVIEGPHFSTAAESRFFRAMGGDVVNMSLYPEVALARELGLCYVNVSFVTDYDAGIFHNEQEPVNHRQAVGVFRENRQKLRSFLKTILAELPLERNCGCKRAPDLGTGGYR